MSGCIDETYAAAIQHDIHQGDGTLVGVVRRPPGWFHAQVEENHRSLGPPDALLDEVKDRQEELQTRGICEEGALNAAWEEIDFERRYREYLDAEEPDALGELVDRAHDGEDLTLVCFEADGKRCHRHVLLDILRDRI